ncbi:N-acetylglucosaminyldiphosphoundecaprenol N-acetyl-beta-D-mannosaminyltransferase [Virgibacillus subterraneus]|uniref:N-acetylglucosaminyldiphosphoundecaprenol N-acetyl-beta-D-mannosaminyltransferase n=2 Tax=Virgibacillus subterraneus TaxID=621109 RepID=A0A1H9AI53_9BACI|nr:N-acetylglucosaminyldiphosphoundecaprenol N-acetyl-beta-D-mannosaminyltransferase [Virgibacillus subterraneus]
MQNMTNQLKTVKIMNVNFINATKDIFLKNHIYPSLMNEHKQFIVTANPEIVMKTRENEQYEQAVQSADYVVPDGAGILIAAKYMKLPLQERIAGYDLMLDLLEFANEKRLSCFFLGAKEEVNEKAVLEVEKRFPNINIAGRHHGFFKLDDQELVEKVQNANADIVFVALGLPRQELWIARHSVRFQKGIFMGVGGSLDVLAGEVNRAPEIWIKLNLEWLYRLLKQPFRVKRILKVFEFMVRIMFRKS